MSFLRSRWRVFAGRLLLVGIALYIFGSCTVRHEPDVRLRVETDDIGRQVKIPLNVNRAVSLAPSLTESVFAVGAGDKLVGVTTFCNYPPPALQIAKVGDTQTPNIETIVALKPDLVLISTASQLEGILPKFESLGIPVFVLAPKNIDDVVRSLRTLGSIFETSERAERAAVAMESRIKYVSGKVSGVRPPRVFVQISREPLFTIGADSFITDLVERAGGESLTKNIPTAYPRLSRETAAALRPEVIFLTTSDDNGEPNAALADSPAVRVGKVFRLDADILSRPGPRLTDALVEIAKSLHPELDIE